MIYDPIASIDWDKFKAKLEYLCPTFKYSDDEVLKLIIETYLYEIMDIGDIDIYPRQHSQEVGSNNTSNTICCFSFPVAQVDKITPLMSDTELGYNFVIRSKRFLEFTTSVSEVCIYYTTQLPQDDFQRLIVNDLLFSYINYRSKAETLEGVKSMTEGDTTVTYSDSGDGGANNSFVLERIKALRTSQCRVMYF